MLVTSKCKNPIRVGDTVCRPGIETSVTKDELDAFLESNIGRELHSLFFKVEEEPEIKAGFEIVDVPIDVGAVELRKSEPEKVAEVEEGFDPAIHTVKHRGGGKWYVMEGDEKVEGPLSPEDRMKYQAMENDS